MVHLLLIESWVRLAGGTGGVLPACVRRMGHSSTFVGRNIDLHRSGRDARGEPHPVLALAERVIEVDTNEIPALCEWAAHEHSTDPDAVFTGCDLIGITDKTVSDAPAFIETMHMFPAQLTGSRKLAAVQAALTTLTALGYENGLAHTEVKLTPAGARVVEVSARMAGNHIHRLIELTTGLDLFELGIQLALGERSVEHELPAPRVSAAVAYLLPPGSGWIDAVEGIEALRTEAEVCEVELRRRAGDSVKLAGSNDDYIGHFIVRSSGPNQARSIAEKLLARVRVHVSQVQ